MQCCTQVSIILTGAALGTKGDVQEHNKLYYEHYIAVMPGTDALLCSPFCMQHCTQVGISLAGAASGTTHQLQAPQSIVGMPTAFI
jgi:hypothetical protein